MKSILLSLMAASILVSTPAFSRGDGCSTVTYERRDGGVTTVETCCYGGICTRTVTR
jgi:hypothetical protein